jgi:hypothetical protein
MPGSDLVAHALLDFGTGMLTLSDPMESYGLVAGNPAQGLTPTGPPPSRLSAPGLGRP